MLAADVVSVTPDGLSTGDGASPALDVDEVDRQVPLAAVSDDGRFVAFASDAANLDAAAPGMGLGPHLYLRDRNAGVTTRVAYGMPVGMSGDGRYVLLDNDRRYAPEDSNERQDVYVYDRLADRMVLVSRARDGEQPDGDSHAIAISQNGGVVLFHSTATNLTDELVTRPSLYTRNLFSNRVVRVTTDAFDLPDPTFPEGQVAQISDDGRLIAFRASAGGKQNVWVRDTAERDPMIGSVHSDGTAADADTRVPPEFALSGNGRRLAFTSGRDVEPGDANGATDMFVRDFATATTDWVTVGATGPLPPDPHVPVFDPDGSHVAFESDADLTTIPDGAPAGERPFTDVYVRDLDEDTTTLMSISVPGTASAGGYSPAISRAPRASFISFIDGAFRVVARHGSGGRLIPLSMGPTGTPYTSDTLRAPVISRIGNLVVFATADPVTGLSPAVQADANGTLDLAAAAVFDFVPSDQTPPTAQVESLPQITSPQYWAYDIHVTYRDEKELDPLTIGDGDLVMTGPNGFRRAAVLVRKGSSVTGAGVDARYSVAAPNGFFDALANGTYTIEVLPGAVRDAAGNALPAGPVASLTVNIPLVDGPDLVAVSLRGAMPPAVVGGTKLKLKPLLLTVRNDGSAPAVQENFRVRLVASADEFATRDDPGLAELTIRRFNLRPGRSKVFRLKPTQFHHRLDGDYRVAAIVDSDLGAQERYESNNTAALAAPVRVSAPFSDIAIAAPSLTGRLAAGKKATLLLTARNDGNVAVRRSMAVGVRLTTNPADPNATSHVVFGSLKLNLKPGQSKLTRARLTLPESIPPGTYFLVVDLELGTDNDPGDNVATGATTYIF